MIRLKVNGPLPGYHPGQVVRVETDASGTPLSGYWRRRLEDARVDGCVEVVAPDAPDAAAGGGRDEPSAEPVEEKKPGRRARRQRSDG